MNKKKECDVFILGASGMLGNSILRYFKSKNKLNVIGSIRSSKTPQKLNFYDEYIVKNLNIEDENNLREVMQRYCPKIIINCIGLVKQIDSSTDPIKAIQINSLLPHRLTSICESVDAKLIHISTDCVFNGKKGMYNESDDPNATDLYGRTKLLGEIIDSKNITLRTSIIGHELSTKHSLLEWFLSQDEEINGFDKAIFSGLPTVELSRVIHDFVIPNKHLNGLYNVSSEPINKFELLSLISDQYSKKIKINVDSGLVINRSLNSSKFQDQTGYKSPSWKDMIYEMHKFG
tara:strand:- start:17984 stop:18853 length:870 start_codon:yes stop_codon:yes gene_type:complete